VTEDRLSADDEQTLRIAKAHGLTARPAPIPDPPSAAELRRAVECFDATLCDALWIICLHVPPDVDAAMTEFHRRAHNLREYTRDLLTRLP
jgi:hypothetical protein